MSNNTKLSLVSFFILGSLTVGLFYHYSEGNIQKPGITQTSSEDKPDSTELVSPEQHNVSISSAHQGQQDKKELDYQVFFSQVYSGNHKTVRNNPLSMDHQLARVLARARKHIYCAVQELDSDVFANALLAAHRR
ncbi:MAG: hypothetical protein OEZ36_04355, partial [Spirochaetota bacterium]|nr:hypothetical protein [Spirochaetota bacterium]